MNEINLKFYGSLLKHIDNVQIAGRIIGVPEELLRKREKSNYDRWDSSEWLAKNHDKMVFHRKTVDLIHDVMIDLGYVLTDNCPWSFTWPGEGGTDWIGFVLRNY